MSDYGPNRLFSLVHKLHSCSHNARLNGSDNLRICHAVTRIATVHGHFFRLDAGNPLYQVQLGQQCMAIIRIARKSQTAHHEVASIGHRNPYFHAELVVLVHLVLVDAHLSMIRLASPSSVHFRYLLNTMIQSFACLVLNVPY